MLMSLHRPDRKSLTPFTEHMMYSDYAAGLMTCILQVFMDGKSGDSDIDPLFSFSFIFCWCWTRWSLLAQFR